MTAIITRRKIIFLLLVVFLSLVADQITKRLVEARMVPNQSIEVWDGHIRITFVYNKGMAFGLNPHEALPNLPIPQIITGFMLLATIFLLTYYILTPDQRWHNLLGLTLIIGGAAGNLLDRLSRGMVVDFIDMGINERLRWPVYNVADSCITVGIALLFLIALRQPKPAQDL